MEGNNMRAKLRNALKSMVSQDCSCHVGVYYVVDLFLCMFLVSFEK